MPSLLIGYIDEGFKIRNHTPDIKADNMLSL